ncbi:MAG: ABC-F family ATP-binding cassette domain-containing protein, partial [Leptospiraceae bacterium]|nr:ABC-F family ATP-binding cassette domain-containing protein [Leptospiraceae bacterium]
SVHGDVSVGFYLPQIIAPEERSGGQRQRSRWEVLMEARPGMDSLLLLDEPFRHLDQEFRLRALTFLEGLRCHMLIVSHDLDLLERADSILHLQAGEVQIYGGGYDTYRRIREAEGRARGAEAHRLQKEVGRLRSEERRIASRQIHRTRKAERDNLTQNIPKSLIHRQKGRAEKTAARLSNLQKRKQTENDQRLKDSKEQLSLYARDSGVVEIPASRERSPVLHWFHRKVMAGNRTIWKPEDLLSMDVGERVWLQGPNGSGKTTLLKCIVDTCEENRPCGHEDPIRGTYFYLDQDLLSLENQEPLIAHLLEKAQPLAQPRGRSLPEMETRLRTLLGYSGISGDQALRPCYSFSGGEKIRALLCLAAALEPSLLILDEPEQNLDILAREELVQSLAQFEGSILFSTHDAGFARELKPGRILKLP